MPAPATRIVKPLSLAAMAGLATLVVACGSSSASGPVGLPKPADAGQAVSQAIARKAVFKDLRYDTSSSTSGTPYSGNPYSGTSSGYREFKSTPPEMHNVTTHSSAAVTYELIYNAAKGVECSIPSNGQQPQRYTVAPTTNIGSVGPFTGLQTPGSTWRYAADITINGHTDWQAVGKIPGGTGFTDVTHQELTTTVLINSITGLIEKTSTHQVDTLTAGGTAITDSSATNFVYDHGVTIPACN